MLADALILVKSLVDQVLEGPLLLGAALAAALLAGQNLAHFLMRRIQHR